MKGSQILSIEKELIVKRNIQQINTRDRMLCYLKYFFVLFCLKCYKCIRLIIFIVYISLFLSLSWP